MISCPTYTQTPIACIVDLKYITSWQIIELNYQGQRRRLAVQSISGKDDKPTANDSLSQKIDNLSINSSNQLWLANWDCAVTVITDDKVEAAHQASLSTSPITHHAHG